MYRQGMLLPTIVTHYYSPGPGCSACPQDSGGCSQSYPGLCSPGQLVQSTPAMATTTQYPNIATTANNNQSSLLFSCDFTTLSDDCLIKYGMGDSYNLVVLISIPGTQGLTGTTYREALITPS